MDSETQNLLWSTIMRVGIVLIVFLLSSILFRLSIRTKNIRDERILVMDKGGGCYTVVQWEEIDSTNYALLKDIHINENELCIRKIIYKKKKMFLGELDEDEYNRVLRVFMERNAEEFDDLLKEYKVAWTTNPKTNGIRIRG